MENVGTGETAIWMCCEIAREHAVVGGRTGSGVSKYKSSEARTLLRSPRSSKESVWLQPREGGGGVEGGQTDN